MSAYIKRGEKNGILDAIKKGPDATDKTDTWGGSKPVPNVNVLSRAEVEAIIEARAREKNMQHARWQVSIVDDDGSVWDKQ